jgi:hypothetical protein
LTQPKRAWFPFRRKTAEIAAAASVGECMMMKRIGAALGAGLIALSVSAEAGTLQARWQTDTEYLCWEQDTNPTPTSYDLGSSTTVAVWDASDPNIASMQFLKAFARRRRSLSA